MGIDESKHVDAFPKHSLVLTAIFFVFDTLSIREAIFELSLKDDCILFSETDLSLPLLHTLYVLPLVFQLFGEEVSPFSVLLPPKKSASVCSRGLPKHALIGKQSIAVEFSIVAVLVLLARLTPPFQLPAAPHPVFEGAFEAVAVGTLPACAVEKILPEAALKGQVLVDVSSPLAFRLVVDHSALEVGPIGEDVQSWAFGSPLEEAASEEGAVVLVHFANSMRHFPLEFSLVDVIAELSHPQHSLKLGKLHQKLALFAQHSQHLRVELGDRDGCFVSWLSGLSALGRWMRVGCYRVLVDHDSGLVFAAEVLCLRAEVVSHFYFEIDRN